jgi:UrcA family protein
MTRLSSAFLLHRASERVSAAAAAVALTFLTLLSVDVRAEVPADPPSVRVAYSELSFDTNAGAAEVYRKLRSAARKVCGLNRGAVSLHEYLRQRDCFDAAVAHAVRQIDRPKLTALHDSSARTLG